jgi:hypothetical protein
MKPLPTFSVGVRPWPLIRHAYLGSFLEPEDIKNQNLGAIWPFSKAAGLLEGCLGHKGPVYKRPRCIGAERP